MTTITTIYANHAEYPRVPDQYLDEILAKPIAKLQMVRTSEGLLPGHIILLWRIQFGSYLTTSQPHKYFATTYGIDAEHDLVWLIEEGYVFIEGARDALRHQPITQLKAWLKDKGISGLSKMKRADLDKAVLTHFSDQELEQYCQERAYLLTEKGLSTLANHPEIVAKHPQKKF
ncbi:MULTISPECIES: hypothetical protein [unclassified Streptococcus]|uniref:hypothetical protein n=1 Tax=unclassified Streptococcus TaxID=2608887 RepID=UPI00359DE166